MKRGPHAALAALLNGSQVQKETLRERKSERMRERERERTKKQSPSPHPPYRCCRHFIDELCIDRVNQTFILFIPSFIHSFIAHSEREREREICAISGYETHFHLQVPSRSFWYIHTHHLLGWKLSPLVFYH